MYVFIIDRDEIIHAQEEFKNNLLQFADAEIMVRTGHMGGGALIRVFWSRQLGIWFNMGEPQGNHYANIFGFADKEPSAGSRVRTICEISIPLSGISRKVGGAFVKSDCGGILVAHRGVLNRGKNKLSKKFFDSNYVGEWIDVEGGERLAEVGVLNTPEFQRNLVQFFQEIARIKSLPPHKSGELSARISSKTSSAIAL